MKVAEPKYAIWILAAIVILLTLIGSLGVARGQQNIEKAALISLRPHHIALSVPNLEESVKWYEQKLSFKVLVRREIKPLSLRVVNLELNGFQIELFERAKSVRNAPPSGNVPDDLLNQGYRHVALVVDDIGAAMTELKKRDVEVMSDPDRSDELKLWWAFIKDNNGNLIEIVQPLQ